MKKIAVLMCALLMLAGCGIGDTNTTYARRDIGVQGEYETGQIVDMMPIKTEGTNALGGLAGGVAGGAAGSMIGGNTAVNIIGATAWRCGRHDDWSQGGRSTDIRFGL